jgi:hypothetical protein
MAMTSDSLLAIAFWMDADGRTVADIGHEHRAFATVILDSPEFHDELVDAAECVVAQIRKADIDRLPARMDWSITGPSEGDDHE